MHTGCSKALALAASLLAVAGGSQAAMIYRCGQTYQQVPCEGGKALNTAPAPSEEQRRQAQERADAEQRLANDMAEDRHRQEAADAKARAKDEAASERERKAAAKSARKDAEASEQVVLACPSPVYVELAPGEKKKAGKSKSGCPAVIYVPAPAKPAASAAVVAQQPAPKKK
ncbi:hypothetical protein LRH25_19305 [Ideonella azotifigens]|uniref:DUF4124 domain-containing protein n=1 Tax=Ideonella azotifigens TaxID=513160 RepID=A0ABN1K646_9BURK|nr:hypothetical protein [Ideonella azotifigens]MCD2342480.1 hypothetical protein [Ideonella azotifigens]